MAAVVRSSLMAKRRSRAISPAGDEETADEAKQRYYREESHAMGGVFSAGGATAGGIFGDGQILTQEHDGPALRRQVQALGSPTEDALRKELAASRKLIRRLERRLEESDRRQLPGRSRGRLPEVDEDLDDEDDEDLE